ncbi:BLOC-1-related complex subunit 8 isoform X4 [Aquila chrysaetos chrysaetos]|uniref:BLOC-1-related complex subunit 8 isoform X4 n=1 Tax=Aquila chrysaetos chrysaetos TaxID=223781 RepID=UPI001B7D44FF|nr:BLOC-1-related complex subunit 8 isoform X4 [Aquila chrysaetos chrysaetos]
MEEPEMQLKGLWNYSCQDRQTAAVSVPVTDKFTESMYVLANEPSVALYRLQEHVRRSLPELAQHKSDMQSWEEQSQGAIYTVEYACRYKRLLQAGGLCSQAEVLW